MTFSKTLMRAVVIACLIASTFGSALPGQGNTIYIPKNSLFTLELLSPITSDRNKQGDEFNCRVAEPSEYAGATVTGRIAGIKASGKANKKSAIALTFDRIAMGDRAGVFDAQVTEVYDVSAGNQGQADEEGVVKGKSKKKIAVKRGILGGLIGAGIGWIFGGPQGAIAGASVGAGMGAGSTLVTDGPELDF
ncbi:MAG TPA: hypothetical protein VNI02_01125, partial [Blastocatellia bacterium]|nr:hypothetical protein [Blastocatellia bacterium]